MIHEHVVRVYYEDTDLAGIVYYANYLKFFERGRSEAVRAVGIDQRALQAETGMVFAVRRANIDYVGAARLDDLLTIRTWARKLGGATIDMRQEAWAEGRLLTYGEIKVACMSTDGKALRIPADIRQKLAGLVRPAQ